MDGTQPVVVFPSALISRKCPRLALEALAHAPDVRLQFAHGGPQESMLRRVAKRLGVADRVDFLGKVPRAELFERLAQASAALFTGVREEGGLALAEALSLGTPVVVLSVGGARTLGRAAPDPTRVALIDPYDPRGARAALGAAMVRFVRRPVVDRSPNLDAAAAEARLISLVGSAIGCRLEAPPARSAAALRQFQDHPPLSPVASATGGDR
ncbi:MAG: glycosyltransferase [Gemmatimonadetes bacterium]|nr:glycosyltransferase [Gemmatimonadota bacterium]